MPSEVGPALDAANRGLAVLPKEKIDGLLTETSKAVGGLGPRAAAPGGLDDQHRSGTSRTTCRQVNDIIDNSAPILDSQVQSGDAIQQWARNLNTIASQTAAAGSGAAQRVAAGGADADQVTAVFSDVRDSLPQTLANLASRHRHAQALSQGSRAGAGDPAAGRRRWPRPARSSRTRACCTWRCRSTSRRRVSPGSCLRRSGGRRPTPAWRRCRRARTARSPRTTRATWFAVRATIRAPTYPASARRRPKECRSNEPYVPLGTNPWYGDPNQILTCPAPAARCDQPVKPGYVIPGTVGQQRDEPVARRSAAASAAHRRRSATR